MSAPAKKDSALGHQEIECRFLEIDKDAFIAKLRKLGAVDNGEVLLDETILYDRDLKWKKAETFVRVRKAGDKTTISYKEHNAHTVDGTLEIEFVINGDDFQKAELLFEKVGLLTYRHQQKKRHTFLLDGVTIDIDTWPKIPTYVELEGDSEASLKKAAAKLGFDWKNVDFHNAGWIIENIYHIPIREMKWFTFGRFE